jgi:hypothetical protein
MDRIERFLIPLILSKKNPVPRPLCGLGALCARSSLSHAKAAETAEKAKKAPGSWLDRTKSNQSKWAYQTECEFGKQESRKKPFLEFVSSKLKWLVQGSEAKFHILARNSATKFPR